MLRSICKQSGESVESVLGMKRKATVGRICWKEGFKPVMKECGVMDDKSGERSSPTHRIWLDDIAYQAPPIERFLFNQNKQQSTSIVATNVLHNKAKLEHIENRYAIAHKTRVH